MTVERRRDVRPSDLGRAADQSSPRTWTRPLSPSSCVQVQCRLQPSLLNLSFGLCRMSTQVASRALCRSLHSSRSVHAAPKNCQSFTACMVSLAGSHHLMSAGMVLARFPVQQQNKGAKGGGASDVSFRSAGASGNLGTRLNLLAVHAGWKFCRRRCCVAVRERSRPSVSFTGGRPAARPCVACWGLTRLPVSAGTYRFDPARRQSLCI